MNTKGTAGKLISFYNKFGIIFILILELIIFSVANSNFFTPNNLFLVGRQVSFYGIAGVGMTMVLLVGEIDISVGSILAFTGCLSATLMTQMGLSIPVAFLLTLLLCCVFGLVSGTLTAVLKIPSLIGTLAMQTIIKGFTYLMTGGSSVTGLSDRFKHLGQGFLFGVIPIPLIVMVVMFALGFLLLNRTFLGRRIYAVGGNQEAARLSGIKTRWNECKVYIISGIMVAIAGVVYVARLGAAQANAGQSYEMEAVAASVLGGTSVLGGEGNIVGTVLGAIVVAIIRNAIVLLEVSTYYQQMITGAVILLAVIVDVQRKARAAKRVD